MNRLAALCLVPCFLIAGNVSKADIVSVTITGEVEFNQINSGFLGGVNAGDAASITFNIDSDNFMDGNFPTRGYEIDASSFALSFNGNAIGLQNPFPGGQTPYFVLRDNDPAVDGFFVSTNLDFPIGVPVDQTGIFDQFSNNFAVTYDGNTLNSLNVLDALGSYDFTGLSVFNWTVDDGPFQPMGLVFSQMTISAVPEPSSALCLVGLGVWVASRRRRS